MPTYQWIESVVMLTPALTALENLGGSALKTVVAFKIDYINILSLTNLGNPARRTTTAWPALFWNWILIFFFYDIKYSNGLFIKIDFQIFERVSYKCDEFTTFKSSFEVWYSS